MIAITLLLLGLSLTQSAVSEPQLKQVTACETDNSEIHCPRGYKINVTHANYGRTDLNVCKGPNGNRADCRCPVATGIVRKMCDGKEFCKVDALNNLFGDPCPGVEKYLEISYKCDQNIIVADANENAEVVLSCEPGQTMSVLDASYAEIDGNCSSSKAFDIVHYKCEGESICTVQASNGVFGDPCPGKIKMLEVDYICQSPEETSYACEGFKLHLKCPDDHELHIIRANYGRTSKELCLGGPLNDTACLSANNCMDYVKDTCEGKQECYPRADNGIYTDPCPGTYKYLEVTYKCQKRKPKNLTVCNQWRTLLDCPHQKIEVLGVEFASFQNEPSTKTYMEKTFSSIELIKKKCRGKSKCEVDYKEITENLNCDYVHIKYTCK